MMRTARAWNAWILIALTIFWIYLDLNVFQSALSVALKFILLGAALTVTAGLIGISIAAREAFPFALGLVFFGALVSNIPSFHFDRPNITPEQWKVAAVLAGCGLLVCSQWIKALTDRNPIIQKFKMPYAETPVSRSYLSGQRVKIIVRLPHHRFAVEPGRRCIVGIQRQRKRAQGEDLSTRGILDGAVQDHHVRGRKLPFWVR